LRLPSLSDPIGLVYVKVFTKRAWRSPKTGLLHVSV